MTDDVDRRTLNERPNAADIDSYREEAAEQEASIEVTYPLPNGNEKRMVVSPRGTVVVLNDVSEKTFNQSRPANEIAATLRDNPPS